MKKNSFWGITDQGIASAGNFATTLFLARALPPAEFGTFVLLNSACLIVLGLQGNLIGIPLVVLGASELTTRSKTYLTVALIFTVSLLPISAIFILSAAGSLHRAGSGMLALIYVLAWQLQETSRRALISSFRYRDAIWGDALSYLGQALLVGFLYLNRQISLDRAYMVMALTSLVAVALQCWQVKLKRTSWEEVRTCGTQFWHLGKWLALVSVMSIAEGPISPWLLNWFHGRASAARFQAVMNVWGLTNPIVNGIPAIVMPASAAFLLIRENRNARALIRLGMKYTWEFVLVLAPLFIVLSLWPRVVLIWFYGQDSVYIDQSMALRIGAIVFLITIPMTVFGAVLTGVGRTKTNAIMHSAGAAASLVSSPPLISGAAEVGAMLVEVVSRGVRLVWAVRALRSASFGFSADNDVEPDYASCSRPS